MELLLKSLDLEALIPVFIGRYILKWEMVSYNDNPCELTWDLAIRCYKKICSMNIYFVHINNLIGPGLRLIGTGFCFKILLGLLPIQIVCNFFRKWYRWRDTAGSKLYLIYLHLKMTPQLQLWQVMKRKWRNWHRHKHQRIQIL